MKRKDAFRKLRTICQRLDEVDLQAFAVQPLRLYLLGSVLTDKPAPRDIDLVLVYNNPVNFDPERIYADMIAGRPVLHERAIIELRRGMKMVTFGVAKGSLADWEDKPLLLANPCRLIWRPGANWAAVLEEIEASPLPWPGQRTPDAREQFEAYVRNLPREEYEARIAAVLAEIEGQELPAK